MADMFNMTTKQLKEVEKPKSLKLALVQVFRTPQETAGDLMAQIKQLTADDLAWYAKVFETELGWNWS